MGLFGKKKSPDEYLKDGKDKLERGEYSAAALDFIKASGGGIAEGDYLAGYAYNLWNQETPDRSKRNLAQRRLCMAAENGIKEAAVMLAQYYDTPDYLSEEGAAQAPVPSAPASLPAASAPKRDSFQEGVTAYKAKDFPRALLLFKEAAEEGTASAMYNCGLMYQFGWGTEVDLNAAHAWYEKAAQAGDSQARAKLESWDNILTEQKQHEAFQKGFAAYNAADYAKAMASFKEAAQLGSSAASYNLGVMYEGGTGAEKNLNEALSWYEKAAEAGYEKAAEAIENTKRQISIEEKAAKMRADIEESRQKEKAIASAPGGDDYLKGVELRRAKDFDGAAEAWTKAAALGHPEALKKLTGFYVGSLGVWGLHNKEISAQYEDYDKAIEWGKRAISQGVDVADLVIEAYIEKGQPEEALRFGEEAAGQGLNTEWRLMCLCMDLERYDEAIAWGKKRDAKKGTDEAARRIEQILEETLDKADQAYKEEDYVQYLALSKKAANLGNSAAMYNVGRIYAAGLGTEADLEQARVWIEKAAAAGDEYAKDLLENWDLLQEAHQRDDYCNRAFDAVEAENYTEALPLFEKAANLGDSTAMYLCGLMYKGGDGTEQDLEQARVWFEKAAAAGHKDAETELKNLENLQRQKLSRDWFVLATSAYEAENYDDALILFTTAANFGSSSAMYNVGLMYELGQGTDRDIDKALIWYEKAAALGHEKAKKQLEFWGTIKQLDEGQDLYNQGFEEFKADNYTQALALFKKAAQLGHTGAMYACGLMYEGGHGTKKNRLQAMEWYEKAAAAGNKDAKEWLKKM